MSRAPQSNIESQFQMQMPQSAANCSSEKNEKLRSRRIRRASNELTPAQLAAIPMLLQGMSDLQIADQLQVDRGTILRWRKKEGFAAEFDRQHQLVLEHSAIRLQSLLEPALNVLYKHVTGDDPKAAIRAAAILVRLATPARVARMTTPNSPPAQAAQPVKKPKKVSEEEAFWKKIEASLQGPPKGWVAPTYTEADFEKFRQQEKQMKQQMQAAKK